MNETLLRGMGLMVAAQTLVAAPIIAPRPSPVGGRRPQNGHDGSHRSRS